jgi:accessory gene regulator protein AgrB
MMVHHDHNKKRKKVVMVVVVMMVMMMMMIHGTWLQLCGVHNLVPKVSNHLQHDIQE